MASQHGAPALGTSAELLVRSRKMRSWLAGALSRPQQHSRCCSRRCIIQAQQWRLLLARALHPAQQVLAECACRGRRQQ